MLFTQHFYGLFFLLLSNWDWLTVEIFMPFKLGITLILWVVAIHRHRQNALSVKGRGHMRVSTHLDHFGCMRHARRRRPCLRYAQKHHRYKSSRHLLKSNNGSGHLNGWGSLSDSPQHWYDLLQCFCQPPKVCTREQAFDILWAEACWEQQIQDFLVSHDPSSFMNAVHMSFLPSSNDGIISPHLMTALISSIDSPHCLSGSVVRSNITIDSGASVCISPHRSDFITLRSSQMKIKDLSSSNQVAGEGIVRWTLQDSHGRPVDVELLGYYIPTADVRLLSPQVMLDTFGGEGTITEAGIEFVLSNGNRFSASYCPQSNLPLIPLALRASRNFWNDAFGYSLQSIRGMKSLLTNDNTNLSSPQKELLLWHQRLSHASLNWIQVLMRNRKYLSTTNMDSSLHSGPFIKTKSRAPVCDVSKLKCLACLCAKATTCSPLTQSPCQSPKNFVLKHDHLSPGDCLSVDHYFSPIPGQLLHTFGRERAGYTCGSLFVDHASGKIFNFPQYSANGSETVRTLSLIHI